MKLKKATSARINKPFYKDKQIQITATADSENKFTSFIVECNGKRKVFDVKRFDILKSWQQVEKFLADVK